MAAPMSVQMGQPVAWKPKEYPRLARLMGRSQDATIFRRFDDMNMLSLLSLQTEIAALRAEFYRHCKTDDLSNPGLSEKKVKEYNELLLQVSQLSNLNRPLKEDLTSFRRWLYDPNGGADFLAKNHNVESFLYEPENAHDLFTLSHLNAPNLENDPFARLLRKRVVPWYHFLIGQRRKNSSRIVDEESRTVQYGESAMNKTVNVLASVLSGVLPLIAIVILYRWKSTQTRIYIAVGLTALFALVLTLTTDARRVEIFGATATFAAVEVVFIGSVSGQ